MVSKIFASNIVNKKALEANWDSILHCLMKCFFMVGFYSIYYIGFQNPSRRSMSF